MSFGHSDIFPFPAVQYIPFTPTTIQEGKMPRSTSASPLLLMAGELSAWDSSLRQDYGINLPKRFPSGTCPVLTLNFTVESIKYRGFNLIMLCRKSPGHFHLFTFPTERLYKPKLSIACYDSGSGERIFIKYGVNV